MVFSAVSIDSSFEVVDLVRVDERNKTRTKKQLEKTKQQHLYASLRHTDAVRSRMKAEWEKSFSTAALSKPKRNGPEAIL